MSIFSISCLVGSTWSAIECNIAAHSQVPCKKINKIRFHCQPLLKRHMRLELVHMTCFSIVLVAVSASGAEWGNIAGGQARAYHYLTKHSLQEYLPYPLYQQNMSPHALRLILNTAALKPNTSLAQGSILTHLSEMPQTLRLPNYEVNRNVCMGLGLLFL